MLYTVVHTVGLMVRDLFGDLTRLPARSILRVVVRRLSMHQFAGQSRFRAGSMPGTVVVFYSRQAAERQETIIAALATEGLFINSLLEEVDKDLAPFNLICHIAFNQPPPSAYEFMNRKTIQRKPNILKEIVAKSSLSVKKQVKGTVSYGGMEIVPMVTWGYATAQKK